MNQEVFAGDSLRMLMAERRGEFFVEAVELKLPAGWRRIVSGIEDRKSVV